MKRIASILWLSIGLVAVSVLDGHAQQSFPLLCRGGSQMRTRAHAGNAQHTFNIPLGLVFTESEPSCRPARSEPGESGGNAPGFTEACAPTNPTSCNRRSVPLSTRHCGSRTCRTRQNSGSPT